MTRKTTFSEGWSWFRFTNLGIEPGMALKLYTSVAKGLKLKVSKFYVYRSYRGKTGKEVFFPSLLSSWIRLIGQKYEKIKKEFIKIFKSSRQSLIKKFLVVTPPTLLQWLIFWHFVYYQSISPRLKENIIQVSRVKISNLTVSWKQFFGYSVEMENRLLKAFTVTYWQFFDNTNFFEPNKDFFWKSKSSLEVWRGKRKFSDKLGHSILEL